MGVISGIVTYANGQPSTMSYVSAKVGGLFAGGVTARVRTDSHGRFTLTWSGNDSAEIVFCDGYEVAKNIRNGTNNLHIVKR
ncbi:MAG: hypothetical protein ACYC1M_05295 [Armatimonadota bacterium]